jgi:hypothetical protein
MVGELEVEMRLIVIRRKDLRNRKLINRLLAQGFSLKVQR